MRQCRVCKSYFNYDAGEGYDRELCSRTCEVNELLGNARARQDSLVECLQDLSDKLPGDAGMEIAMSHGFDAELYAIRVALAQAKEGAV